MSHVLPRETAAEVDARNPRCAVLPVGSFEHHAWRATVSVPSAVLTAYVTGICDSVTRSGFGPLVIVNGHGGNYVLSNLVQEASAAGRRMALFPGREDWKKARLDAALETTDHEDMHAGELETSILLHSAPDGASPGSWTCSTAPDPAAARWTDHNSAELNILKQNAPARLSNAS